MYRVWGKIIKKNRIESSYVSINEESDMDEAQKLILAMEDICQEFDIGQPIWLQDHQLDILTFSKTTFREEHFIESIDFDILEVEIIEVDNPK